MPTSRVQHPVACRPRDRRIVAAVSAAVLLVDAGMGLAAATLPAAAAERIPSGSTTTAPPSTSTPGTTSPADRGAPCSSPASAGLTQGPGSRMTVAKFNAAGKRVWQTPTIPGVKTWVGMGASSRGYALAVDRHGDAIVAGYSSWSSGGFAVVKFSGADGSVLWWQDLQVAGYASAADVVLDRAGNAYATGMVEVAGPGFGICTVKLAATTGNVKWQDVYSGPQNECRQSAHRDRRGAQHVRGRVRRRIRGRRRLGDTQALHPPASPCGRSAGTAPHNDDTVRDIVTRADGRAVYVCGSTENGTTNATDAVLMRYSASGRRVWVRRYTAFETDSSAEDVCFDSTGSLLLCGRKRPLDSTKAVRTLLVKVTPKGRKVWSLSSPSPYNADGDCMYSNVVAGASGNLYVSGLVEPSNTNAVTLVEKRSPTGRLMWRGSVRMGRSERQPGNDDGARRLYATVRDGDGREAAGRRLHRRRRSWATSRERSAGRCRASPGLRTRGGGAPCEGPSCWC